MRGIVLGASGAVGSETIAELRRRGHAAVTVGRTDASEVRADVTTERGRRAVRDALRPGDVVINASGRDDLHIADLAEAAPLVDVSADGRYLDALSRRLASRGEAGAAAVLGAGIAPGLSTVLLAAIRAEPGDELDLGVTLGSGEHHGDAAMAWTQALIGAPVYRPAEHDLRGGREVVANLRESRRLPGLGTRRRLHLRADFPDHVLLGAARGTPVRSYLALSSAGMTVALAALARMPRLAGLLRTVPAVGSEAWRVVVLNRRTGERLAVEGEGQSRATGILAAFAAERVGGRVGLAGARRALTMADLCTPEDAAARLGARLIAEPARAG